MVLSYGRSIRKTHFANQNSMNVRHLRRDKSNNCFIKPEHFNFFQKFPSFHFPIKVTVCKVNTKLSFKESVHSFQIFFGILASKQFEILRIQFS
jgi:hypothetical protein